MGQLITIMLISLFVHFSQVEITSAEMEINEIRGSMNKTTLSSKESTLQCRGLGMIPSQRTKTPHTAEQGLSPRASTTEPTHHN